MISAPLQINLRRIWRTRRLECVIAWSVLAILAVGIAVSRNAAPAVPVPAVQPMPPISSLRQIPGQLPASLGLVRVGAHVYRLKGRGRRSFIVHGNETIGLGGWTFDSGSGLPVAGIFIRLGSRDVVARYGIARPDVAAAFHNTKLVAVGFDVNFLASDLDRGISPVTLIIIPSDAKGYMLDPIPLEFRRK